MGVCRKSSPGGGGGGGGGWGGEGVVQKSGESECQWHDTLQMFLAPRFPLHRLQVIEDPSCKSLAVNM